MLITISTIAFLLLVSTHRSNGDNSTDTCQAEGLWGSLLEEWATAPQNGRQGRVMALPTTSGYYVTSDGLTPPPPTPPRAYDEWHTMNSGGKILNRPNNHYGENFKPSLPPPQPPQQQGQYQYHQQSPSASYQPQPVYQHQQQKPHQQQIPPQNIQSQQVPIQSNQQHQAPNKLGLIDRVDEKPNPQRKEVSETDLYLLGAIEKLVYRVDLMEKRLRKMEENIHFLLVGQHKKPAPDPCPSNFTRVGTNCYHFSKELYDWKTSNLACRKIGSHLLEFDDDKERKLFIVAVQGDPTLKDTDWWTSGLNPGLLWIWSHSAKPVVANSTSTVNSNSIAGEGRCLGLNFETKLKTHVYRGQDCAFKHRYVCEKQEDKSKLSNEIERVAKALRPLTEIAANRRSRIMWDDDDTHT